MQNTLSLTSSSHTSLPSVKGTLAPVLLATNTLRTQSQPLRASSTVCLRGITLPPLTPWSAVNTTLQEPIGDTFNLTCRHTGVSVLQYVVECRDRFWALIHCVIVTELI